jgi:hypothetical protein
MWRWRGGRMWGDWRLEIGEYATECDGVRFIADAAFVALSRSGRSLALCRGQTHAVRLPGGLKPNAAKISIYGFPMPCSVPTFLDRDIAAACHHTPRGHPAAKDLSFLKQRSFAAAQDDRCFCSSKARSDNSHQAYGDETRRQDTSIRISSSPLLLFSPSVCLRLIRRPPSVRWYNGRHIPAVERS